MTHEDKLKAAHAQARLNEAKRAANEAKRAANEAKYAAKKTLKNLSGGASQKTLPEGTIAKLELLWRTAFAEHYPLVAPARWWTGVESRRPGKEAGLVSQLIQMYSVEDVAKYLRWAIVSWGDIQTRFKNVPVVPTIGFLVAFRETLLPEAVLEAALVENKP